MAKRNFGKEAQHDVALAKKEVKKHLDNAKKNLEIAKKNLAETERKAEQYVKDEPVKAVAIAAGVGAAIGALAMYLASHKKK